MMMSYHPPPSSSRVLRLTSTITIPAPFRRLPPSILLLRRHSVRSSPGRPIPASTHHLHSNSNPEDDDNVNDVASMRTQRQEQHPAVAVRFPRNATAMSNGGMNPILMALLTSRGRPATEAAAAAMAGPYYSNSSSSSNWEYGVACNDCCKSFRSADSLHQHQWDSAHHTRVTLRSPSSNFSLAPWPWTCSHCTAIFPTAYHLEAHFSTVHPLIEVAENDEEWVQVAGRFLASWKKSEEVPEVRRIFKVYNAGWRRLKYEERRRELKHHYADKKRAKLNDEEEACGLRSLILNDGNERLAFHGTTVGCSRRRLIRSPPSGTDGAPVLCELPHCSLCSILRYGFHKEMCRKHRFQRFGTTGIYTSSVSGKANDYVRWYEDVDGASSPLHPAGDKVMLLCKVLAGRPFPSTRNQAALTAPPPGFDSVHGKPGVASNYDELVLYDNRAILPGYVVHYACTSPFTAK